MKHLVAVSFLLFLFTLSACGPMSKEKYMIQYKNFINKVSENHENYSIEDWKKIDEKYKKFNEDWYKKYKEDFTWKDEIILGKYSATYNLYKTSDDINDILEAFSIDQKNIDKLKEKIKYYSENDMNDDIEYILKQAKESGETATETVENILKELNIKLDESKDK